MSTLTRKRILGRLRASRGRLVVTPILSKRQIGDSSIDLRLGNQFIVFRTHMLGAFEPYQMARPVLRKMQERQVVKFGTPFVLHPGTLALGASFEYLSVPSDLECQVEGRSSWARVGLQIATATHVEPGFKGVVTLELSNMGTIPVELYPGFRIAQVVFRTAKPRLAHAYSGKHKYMWPVGPEFSHVHKDEDGKVFARKESLEE
jgi:dCTP deaminase